MARHKGLTSIRLAAVSYREQARVKAAYFLCTSVVEGGPALVDGLLLQVAWLRKKRGLGLVMCGIQICFVVSLVFPRNLLLLLNDSERTTFANACFVWA